jgi:hypothetical protein
VLGEDAFDEEIFVHKQRCCACPPICTCMLGNVREWSP